MSKISIHIRIDTHTEFGSENFEEFLDVLGEKIRLKGWERFRGGLDVKGKLDSFPMYLNFFFFQTEISCGRFMIFG